MNETSSATPGMTPQERELVRKWVQNWKELGPILERLRRAELRRLDAFQAIKNLTGSLDFSREPYRPRPHSGLVEQQAWFSKGRLD